MDNSVSVIIPVYNGASTLRRTIESVLAQTHRPLEIILADDGSEDGSSDVARATCPDIRRITLRHGGVSRARNAGADAARGKYIAFIDADDLWRHDKLQKQLALAEGAREDTIILCLMRDFLSEELSDKQKSLYRCDETAKTGYHAGCVLIEKKSFLATGGFPEDHALFETVEWFTKAKAMNFPIAIVEEVLMLRRIHGANTMLKDRKAVNEAYIRLIRDKLAAKGNPPHNPDPKTPEI